MRVRTYRDYGMLVPQAISLVPFISLNNLPIFFSNSMVDYTDDVGVKVPSFHKVTQFLQYKIFHRNTIRLNFVCLKIVLTAVI